MKKLHSINVDDKLWKQAKLETKNMSLLIQTFLENYIETNDIEKIEVRIVTLETELATLYTKKLQLIKSKTSNESKSKLYQSLKRQYFIDRRNQLCTDWDVNDSLWLNDPEIKKKCDILGIKPEIIITQLKREFDDLEVKLHTENIRKS